jgi:hypothetical protein
LKKKSKIYLFRNIFNHCFLLLFFYRDNLSKQLEITNVKLKTESLNLNLLQEQCAELEKEKKIMDIEFHALQKDYNTRFSLLDSEINSVSFQR